MPGTWLPPRGPIFRSPWTDDITYSSAAVACSRFEVTSRTAPCGGSPGATVMEVTAKPTRAGIYDIPSSSTASGTGSGSRGTRVTTKKKLSLTESVLLDIPQILGTDSPFGFDWAAGPKNSAERWDGAILYRSRDDGTTYEVAAKTTKPHIIGKATTVLGDYTDPLTDPDEVNTITVRLTRADATLESTTDAALANGANLCAVRSGDTWELLQFRDATLIDPQTYELSYLMRGRLETEDAIPDHAVGDTFVLLPVTNVDAPESDLNVPLLYKAVTMGAPFDSAPWVEFTNTGKKTDTGGGGTVRHLPALIVLHTETSYTFVEADRGKWHIWNAAGAATVTLPAALKKGWQCVVANIATDPVTLDPANDLDGDSASIDLEQFNGISLATDAVDYFTVRGMGSGGGAGSSLTVKDEGSTVETGVTEINVVGIAATAISAGTGKITLAITGYIAVLDDGTPVASFTTLDFTTGIAVANAGSGVATIKLADMAQSTFKGRAAGAGTGAPTDLTATQATAIINPMVGDSGAGGTKGTVDVAPSGRASSIP